VPPFRRREEVAPAMPRAKRAAFAAACLAALLAAPAGAREPDAVVVLPATGSNIHPGHLAAATDVLRVQLERAGLRVLPVPAGSSTAQEPTPEQAGAAAERAGAAWAVTLRIARLGTNAVCRVGSYLPGGRLSRADELTASSPEDLEPVLRRLALSLVTGRPARELAELETVTEREADPFLKYVATHYFGIRLGAFFAREQGGTDPHTASLNGGGIFWLYDARWFIAEVSVDLQTKGEDDSIFGVGIGAYYPFTRGNVAPYLGGGLAYSWVEHSVPGAQPADGKGISFRAGGGLIVGRLSTVHFRIDGGFWFDAFQSVEKGSGASHRYWGPQLNLGLAF
jgi:hypothetical protein